MLLCVCQDPIVIKTMSSLNSSSDQMGVVVILDQIIVIKKSSLDQLSGSSYNSQ